MTSEVRLWLIIYVSIEGYCSLSRAKLIHWRFSVLWSISLVNGLHCFFMLELKNNLLSLRLFPLVICTNDTNKLSVERPKTGLASRGSFPDRLFWYILSDFLLQPFCTKDASSNLEWKPCPIFKVRFSLWFLLEQFVFFFNVFLCVHACMCVWCEYVNSSIGVVGGQKRVTDTTGVIGSYVLGTKAKSSAIAASTLNC